MTDTLDPDSLRALVDGLAGAPATGPGTTTGRSEPCTSAPAPTAAAIAEIAAGP